MSEGNGRPAHGRLLPQHLADLRKSGLSDAAIAAAGFHSLQAPASVQAALRWKSYRGDLGDCLAIPFVDAAGNPTGYCRLKPDRPRKCQEDGKPIKYESPKGAPNLPYLPPQTLAALQDPAVPLLITEGEKKAAKAGQEGFPCIGLVGVCGWQKKRARDKEGKATGDRELIPGLTAVAWRGRAVYVVFDSDAAVNPNVRAAEWHLAECLAKHGATVKIVRLPPGEPGADGTPVKIGLDDFLVAHGLDALRKLLAEALDPAPPPVDLKPREAADDPHRLARLYVKDRCGHPHGLTLRNWREEWHRWQGDAYRTVADKELRAELTGFVKAEMDRVNILAQKLAAANGEKPPDVRKVTGRLVADVAHALTGLTILSGQTEAPAWLGKDRPFPASEVLACKNGLIHLPSLVAGKYHFWDPTPGFFSPNVLDFDFDLNAPPPATWLGLLGQLWPDDEASIATLQDWMGYLLMPETQHHKILLLVGPPRSGKGTIARVIRGLIGPDNVAGPTLASLGQNFGLWPLLGKTVAMVQDARISQRPDVAVVTERLLSLSGEDALTIDRKNLCPVTAKLTARFMILTNELPRMNDASGALASRMILLRLTESWLDREDTGLSARLAAELPGILLWAIVGWQRLRDRGHFVQPDAGKAMIGELADLASPVGAFVRERCRVGPGCQIERSTLFEAWKRWCDEQGREHAGNAIVFGRDLRAAVPALGDAQPRSETGDRVRVYEGICLK
jgi:putative DNA primase/helicase